MTEIGHLDVSRETIEKLHMFVALVGKWTPKINLISKASVSDIWERHIVDSVQLFGLAKIQESWADLGSGGGFPGLVIAILASEAQLDRSVTLVESDQRKCAFLRTVIRELELKTTVISDRIEDVPALQADVVSARALADLSILLGFADMHLTPGGVALFPKGENWRKEHEQAQSRWSYTCEPIKSETNPSAAVLKIKDIKRV